MKSIFRSSLLVLLVACGGGGPTAPESAVPFITSLSPSPVRAGQVVRIVGRDLSGGIVLFGGQPVDAISIRSSEITFQVPMNASPGTFLVAVRSSFGTSSALPLEVEIFTVTGRYSGTAILLVNTCDFGGDPGTINFIDASMIDERPDLTVRLGGTIQTGELDPDGSFRTQDIEGLIIATLEGQVGLDSGGSAIFDATLTILSSNGCITIDNLDARRISELP